MHTNKTPLARLLERLALDNNALTGTVPLEELSRLDNLGEDSGIYCEHWIPTLGDQLINFSNDLLR